MGSNNNPKGAEKANNPNKPKGKEIKRGSFLNSRRSYLRNFGLGVGIIGASGIGSSLRPKAEIEIGTDPEGNRVKVEVSARWWNHVERARRVTNQVSEQLVSNPGIRSVGRQKQKDTINGHNKKEVIVEIDANHPNAQNI